MAKAKRYSRDQREEHNLIAKAILFGAVIPDEDMTPEQAAPKLARQAPTHNLSWLLEESYRHHVQSLRDCSKAVLTHDYVIAEKHAEVAELYQRQHKKLAAQYESEASGRSSVVRYADGCTRYITLEGVRFYFDVDMIWKGNRLEVVNRAFLDRMSHISDADDENWEQLCAWVLDSDVGSRPGRKITDKNTLIWLERQGGTFDLRANIAKKYPKMLNALEVVRRNLRLKV